MDLIRGILLRLLLLASNLELGAVSLGAAVRKPGNALSAPGDTTPRAPGSRSLARTKSGQRTASLSPDQRQFNWVYLCPELRKDASPLPPPPGGQAVPGIFVC